MKKNTKFGPEIKRVTLHPLKDDGTIDTDVNLYPKTLIDGVVDRDGKHVDIQEKLIAGDNITIEGNVISSTGGGSSTEYVINITELDQLEHPVSQEQGEEIFETQPDHIHLIYNVNVDMEDITVHLNGDAYWSKQINLCQEVSDSDETKEYENAIVYTLLSDDTLNAIKIDKSSEGEITVNDIAEWNFSSIVESLTGKANNDEVVHLDSDEIINGQKTFTRDCTFNGDYVTVHGNLVGDYDNGYLFLANTDNCDSYLKLVESGVIVTGRLLRSENEYYGLLIPNTYGWTDSQTIATQEYVDNKLSLLNNTVVHNTGDESIAGDKTLTGHLIVDNIVDISGNLYAGNTQVNTLTTNSYIGLAGNSTTDNKIQKSSTDNSIEFILPAYQAGTSNETIILPRKSGTVAIDEDVVHKGSSESPSTEDIYGTKTFKYGTIKVDGGDRFTTIGSDRFIVNNNNTNTEYCANFIWRVLEAETDPESTFLYFPNKSGTFALTDDIPPIPAAPVVDGNYFLKVSVVNGQPTYSWESETAVEDEILEENY